MASNVNYICLINNYNNEKFIGDCLSSVLNQTKSFDQVLVIDDGSGDGSRNIIQEFCLKHSNLRLISKENEGQFSTFNIAVPLIQDKSQIFLLDGDDFYPPDYLESTLKSIGISSWDFAFCERQVFSSTDSVPLSVVISSQHPYFFSETSALVRSRGCWIGNPTSCISLSSDLFKKIFPYPHFRDKSFWADNLMIYASSILGAHKIYLPGIAIGWRDHSGNDCKKAYSQADVLQRENAIKTAFEWYCLKYCIPRYPGVFEFFKEYKILDPHWRRQLHLPNKYRMINRLIRDLVKQYCKNQLDAVRKIFFKGS
jgi:glycosyltransferase involved in cell wall biosynthesis